MEAERWSDCLEILARELAELADNVRQGSLGPGASYQDLKTLYKQRRIDAATERLKTLFSVEYGREFAERTNRVLEQFKTAEFWALQALELHPFGNEHASNLLRELGETYYRETSMVFWKVEFEREDLLDRPELLAMFDALERYDKLVSSLIALRDYLLVVAGLVRAKMQPAELGEAVRAAGPQNALARATVTTPAPKAEPPAQEPETPAYLGGGVVKIGEEARTYQGKFQDIIELLVSQSNAVGPAIEKHARVENAPKEMRRLANHHDGFLLPYIEFPKGTRGRGYTLKIKDSRKK